MAAGLGIAAFIFLKKCANRQRPCAIEPHCWATLLPPDRFSFPSGHTITAFAVALSLAGFYPSLLVGLLFCASSIAVSRILLGMHFLSDVLGRRPDRDRAGLWRDLADPVNSRLGA